MMSGTSLDGLDISCSKFSFNPKDEAWSGVLESVNCIPFSDLWREKLASLPGESAKIWGEMGAAWSRWCGEQVLASRPMDGIDLVVFHGQTVFHQPNHGWTGQLASGAHLYAALGASTPVVCDLRSLDVACGGQGAPLVPLADAVLYPEFEGCLNLGGFSNFSCTNPQSGLRQAWDIGPCNMLFNHLSEELGLAFDDSGQIAASGTPVAGLFQAWRQLEYHRLLPPKSLGREWFETQLLPAMEDFRSHAVADRMATASVYVSSIIREAVQGRTTLVTGGGAYNAHLIQHFSDPAGGALSGPSFDPIIPSEDQINGKEAHAFAFFGLLRVLGLPNTWPSVTGANQPTLGGALWGHPASLWT